MSLVKEKNPTRPNNSVVTSKSMDKACSAAPVLEFDDAAAVAVAVS